MVMKLITKMINKYDCDNTQLWFDWMYTTTTTISTVVTVMKMITKTINKYDCDNWALSYTWIRCIQQ